MAGDWDCLVGDLLVAHYDPAYLRSIRENFPQYDQAARVAVDGISDRDFDAAAARVIATHGN